MNITMALLNKQAGVALVTALVFLSIFALFSISSLRDSGLSERLSTNTQLKQMALSAAISAMERYIAEYNYNVHVVADDKHSASFKTAHLASYLPIRSTSSFYEYCLDESSNLIDSYPLDKTVPSCGSVTLDGSQNAITAKNRITYYGCIEACPGFSFGGEISCHILKMEAQGSVIQTKVSVEQWVTLLGPC